MISGYARAEYVAALFSAGTEMITRPEAEASACAAEFIVSIGVVQRFVTLDLAESALAVQLAGRLLDRAFDARIAERMSHAGESTTTGTSGGNGAPRGGVEPISG